MTVTWRQLSVIPYHHNNTCHLEIYKNVTTQQKEYWSFPSNHHINTFNIIYTIREDTVKKHTGTQLLHMMWWYMKLGQATVTHYSHKESKVNFCSIR